MGWQTFKAHGGSRLMREPGDESRHIQVREGLSGWKKGLTFVRLWQSKSTGGESPSGFYTILCLDPNDSVVAMSTGRTDHDVWKAIYDDLDAKGFDVREGL